MQLLEAHCIGCRGGLRYNVRMTEREIDALDRRAEEMQRRLAVAEERLTGRMPVFFPWTDRVRMQFGNSEFDAGERMRALDEEVARLERWMASLEKRTPQGPVN